MAATESESEGRIMLHRQPLEAPRGETYDTNKIRTDYVCSILSLADDSVDISSNQAAGPGSRRAIRRDAGSFECDHGCQRSRSGRNDNHHWRRSIEGWFRPCADRSDCYSSARQSFGRSGFCCLVLDQWKW